MTAAIIAQDLGFETEVGGNLHTSGKLIEICKKKKSGKNLRPRPPVVTISAMLIMEKPVSWIQFAKPVCQRSRRHHAGYQRLSSKKKGQLITLLTPGHEAWNARTRRQYCRHFVLVVADDGVRPQLKK